ncbi:MAG: hypothetical protein JWN28_178 [Candidatus Saccharibacteria bacterium]|nr:hypothetical protein [Candidatus Saccharibacteria bacterium]
MKSNKKLTYTLIGVFGILIALSLIFILNSTQILRAIGVTQPAPVFTFNVSKAPGWWAAQNYNSRASATDDYQGSEPVDKLPVASMTVFKGKQGEYATACFVMFSYYDYKVDVNQLKTDKDSETQAGTSMQKTSEQSLSIDAFDKARNFTLTSYELIGPDAKNAMKGMSYGWVEVDNGYVSVSGVCPTSGELDDTYSTIEAMSLVKQ